MSWSRAAARGRAVRRERLAASRRVRWGAAAPLVREWLALEVLGHLGLVALRQICGTWWSWRTGGPFAYWDVSRAMLQGDFWWVIAVICASAIRGGLLVEWGHQLRPRRAFGASAWVPWLVPGCLLGWVVLIHGDDGAAYILGLRAGIVFEGYHILFFGYVVARLATALVQLAVSAHLLLAHCHRAWATGGPWPYLPLGVGLVASVALLCAAIYLHIYHQGGSFQARWDLFAADAG